jgi:hypothetical protein
LYDSQRVKDKKRHSPLTTSAQEERAWCGGHNTNKPNPSFRWSSERVSAVLQKEEEALQKRNLAVLPLHENGHAGAVPQFGREDPFPVLAT